MNIQERNVRMYNVLFPVWMLLLAPKLWLIILPGNFVIDSIVLIISMAAFKISDKLQMYKRSILKIFAFGILSDLVGAAYLMLMVMVLHIGGTGEELYLTIPAILISAVCIFAFNYYVTFKEADKTLRFRLAIVFAVITAPYTFLVPSRWLY